jgi:putative secretion ATPase (PEP-CTERM system associated)
MFKEYYKLKTMPFQLTPDREFFYGSREHNRAISHLAYGIAQEEGFIIITGEIGAGKTMLVERLWSELDVRKFAAARILTTQVSGDDLLKMIARGFGVLGEANDKANLLLRLEQLFTEKRTAGKRCLLIIDEVQNLPLAAIEELRMLSNMTIAGRAPFQCVLLGQPQFRQTLADPQLEQLQQRVLASYHLGPLSDAETREYVEHRLKKAGWIGDPSFDHAAFAAIYLHTGGIPRRINTLCSRVLLAGFLDDRHQISEIMITEIAEELHRDMGIGEHPSTMVQPAPRDFELVLEQRLAAIEKQVARHDRTIRRALELIIQMIEASSTRRRGHVQKHGCHNTNTVAAQQFPKRDDS